MSKSITVGKDLITVYRLIKDIMGFIANPVVWVEEYIKKKISKKVKKIVLFYAKEIVYNALGQDRIGCHSLLAKDNGQEWFYKYMKNCALAVHWYVVNVMCRWADTGYSQQKKKESEKWVNWLELLEHFLRHPAAGITINKRQITLPVDITHEFGDPNFRPLSLRGMTQLYKDNSFHESPSYLYWEAIADANFDIQNSLRKGGVQDVRLIREQRQNILSKIFRDEIWTVPAILKNEYVFKKGIRLTVPFMNLKISIGILDDSVKIWWAEVIKRGWEVFKIGTNRKAKPSLTSFKYHKLHFCKDLAEFSHMRDDGFKIRTKMEDSYRLR